MIYTPRHFEVTDSKRLEQLISSSPFATVVASQNNKPIITHIPINLNREKFLLEGHVAKANAISKLLGQGDEVLFIFHGPHAYISPYWYKSHPNLPTWNYAVAHVYAKPEVIQDRSENQSIVMALAQAYEQDKDLKSDVELSSLFDKAIDGIVSFRAKILRIEGKFKLSQNKSVEDADVLIEKLENSKNKTDHVLALLMKEENSLRKNK
jgi:transcriptional regulator